MKKLRYILATLSWGAALTAFSQGNMNDTVFIFKDSLVGTAQSVYFDHNRESKYYKYIANFTLYQFEKDGFKYSIDYLKENKLALTNKTPVIPWKNWVRIKQYKGRFYAYYPCDFLFHLRASVNDSAFIDWTGEGPVANKIIEQRKINDRTYQFKLTGISGKDRELVIHVLDVKKGIAIFEQTVNGVGKQYDLMIAADKVRGVPLIVNSCKTQKQMELTFDEPNYLELLKAK